MNFPYLPYAVRDRAEHYIYRPVIPVDLAGPHGEVDFYALVDTGSSDDTLIPKCVADELGLVTNEERVEEVTGIGGERIAVVQADVELRVSDGRETVFWNAAVGVVAGRDGGGDYVILGHRSCLEYFTASFSGDRLMLDLTPNVNFPGTVEQAAKQD